MGVLIAKLRHDVTFVPKNKPKTPPPKCLGLAYPALSLKPDEVFRTRVRPRLLNDNGTGELKAWPKSGKIKAVHPECSGDWLSWPSDIVLAVSTFQVGWASLFRLGNGGLFRSGSR